MDETSIIVLCVLIAIASPLMAYTSNFQDVTLWMGKKCVEDHIGSQKWGISKGTSSLTVIEWQSVFTPHVQSIRNISYMVLLGSILVYGSFQQWYWGIIGIITVYILAVFINVILLPQKASYYIKFIKIHLQHKLDTEVDKKEKAMRVLLKQHLQHKSEGFPDIGDGFGLGSLRSEMIAVVDALYFTAEVDQLTINQISSDNVGFSRTENVDRVEQLIEVHKDKSTGDLIAIVSTGDVEEWSREALVAMGQILDKRGVDWRPLVKVPWFERAPSKKENWGGRKALNTWWSKASATSKLRGCLFFFTILSILSGLFLVILPNEWVEALFEWIMGVK